MVNKKNKKLKVFQDRVDTFQTKMVPYQCGSDVPWVSRIIIDGNPCFFSSLTAADLVNNLINHWPPQSNVNFLLTPGGFIEFPWPSNLNINVIGNNPNNPSNSTLSAIISSSQFALTTFLCNINQNISKYADYLIIGMDTYDSKSMLHAELIHIVDTKSMKSIAVTGKSYPLCQQENYLLRFVNINSHFISLPSLCNIMVLGCHDLKVFDNRSKALAKKWRQITITQFRNIFVRNKPIFIFHHPHYTDTPKTWINPWCFILRLFPKVHCASAFSYYNYANSNLYCRDTINNVMKKTIFNLNSLDFIIKY